MNIKYQEERVVEILELLNESKKQLINSKNIVEKEMATMKNLTTKINVEDLYLLNLYSGLIEKIDGEILSINNMKRMPVSPMARF